MSSDDQILRAYATISSLRANVPQECEVEEHWVSEFNGALSKVETALGKDLADFKVPADGLYRSVASSNYVTGDVHHRPGRRCRREVLMHKIDSALGWWPRPEESAGSSSGRLLANPISGSWAADVGIPRRHHPLLAKSLSVPTKGLSSSSSSTQTDPRLIDQTDPTLTQLNRHVTSKIKPS